MIYDLIKETRSVRSFGKKRITKEEITEMMECARLSAATRNLQGIKYITVTEDENCKKLFPLLTWASAVTWNPSHEESPTAYIVICSDKNLPIPEKFLYCDIGVASQNILLKAREMGYGGCMLGAFDKNKIKDALGVADEYQVEIILALGEPAEKIKLEDAENGCTSYYRDKNNLHHVPKRILKDIIVDEK